MLGFFRRRSPMPLSWRPRLHTDDVEVVYAVGDIHGCYDLLQELVDSICYDARSVAGRRILVTLGDYVDRGPKSAEVMDWLCGPDPEGFERISLAGNHELMMLEFLDKPNVSSRWLELGGFETLASYGVDLQRFLRAGQRERQAMLKASIPPAHVDLLRKLPSLLITPRALFVHAGLRPGVELTEQSDDDLLWIREPFLSEVVEQGPWIVHGHTPVSKPIAAGKRICVDTGAFATGVLTAVRLSGDEQPSFIDTTRP